MTNIVALFLLCFLSACIVDQEPEPTNSELLVTRGDIVVVSYNTDTLAVFDQSGSFKRILYQVPTAADNIAGIAWLETSNEILISIDGTPDRIEAISILTGDSRNFYNNVTYFTGTPLGLTQLKNSTDVIASEGATIERFNASGIRETFGAIWPANVHANATSIQGLANGNWLSCSSSAGLRISPDSTSALAAIATATGPVGATASYGCHELSNGTIVVSWNGAAADHVYTYSATLTGATAIVNNIQSTLSDPRGVAIGENDEIYVADATQNKIVEMDSSGNVIRQFGNGILNAPRHVLVVPAFSP